MFVISCFSFQGSCFKFFILPLGIACFLFDGYHLAFCCGCYSFIFSFLCMFPFFPILAPCTDGTNVSSLFC